MISSFNNLQHTEHTTIRSHRLQQLPPMWCHVRNAIFRGRRCYLIAVVLASCSIVVGRAWATACVRTQWQFLPYSTNTCPAQAANGQPITFGLTKILKLNFSYLWKAWHITQACTQFKITCLQWQSSSQLVFKQCAHTALYITDCMVTWAALLY